jgi:2-polyprenyl-6-methoxyphenol hydroxylase-like FAD-dependent oxidoreductase
MNMDERHLAEILALYADALSRGEDDSADILARYSEEERKRVESLLGITDLLRTALVPVEPSAAFVRDLGEMLSQRAIDRGRSIARQTRQTMLLVMAALGWAVSVVGIIAFVLRRRRTVVSSQ